MSRALFVTRDGGQFWADDYDGKDYVLFLKPVPLTTAEICNPTPPSSRSVGVRRFERRTACVDFGPILPTLNDALWTWQNEYPDFTFAKVYEILVHRAERAGGPRHIVEWVEYREEGTRDPEPVLAWSLIARQRHRPQDAHQWLERPKLVRSEST